MLMFITLTFYNILKNMQFLRYLLKLIFLLKMKIFSRFFFLFYCEMEIVLREKKKKIIFCR